MSEQHLKAVGDGATKAAPKNSSVSPLLGRLDASVECEGDGAENHTRWLFDVTHGEAGAIEINLRFRYQRPKGELLCSYNLAALSPEFWGANVWIEEKGDDDTSFVLHAKGPCRYRVAIDTIHSATR